MGVTTDVTIWDETSTNSAVHQDGLALPSARSVVLMGVSDGSNVRLLQGTSAGSLTSNLVNATATATTASIASAGTGNFTLTTSSVDQMLCLVEVRPNTTTNDFEIKLYKDSARTKLVYWISNITLDEWVSEEYIALPLPDGIAYGSIVNNAAGARTFTVDMTTEVRS